MKKILFCLAAFAALVSCTKENPIDNTPAVEYQTITFEAAAPSAEDNDATKTTLVEGNLVHWSNGDQVKVGFFPALEYSNILNQNGIFTANFEETSTESTYFTTDNWAWATSESNYRDYGIAAYPDEATVLSYVNRGNSKYDDATTEISYDLPSEQIAVLNSFQSGVNFSYAKVSKADFIANKASLNFINACALLKITLPSTAADVKSIAVSSKNDVALSGKFEIPFGKEGYYHDDPWATGYANSDGTLTFQAVAGNPSVSIVAPEGETLKPGGTYYVVVWPGTHGSGLDFEFTNSEGLTCKKSLASSVTFTRAKVERFNFVSALDFSFVAELELDTESLSFTKDGGSSTVSVTSNTDWTVSDDADWLTVSAQSGKGNGSVTVTAAANTTYEARTATITVTAGTVTKNISVTQDAAERKYRLKSAVTAAADLKEGSMYVIFFAGGSSNNSLTNYCWEINDNGMINRVSSSSVTGTEFTSKNVFIFDNASSPDESQLTSSNNGYGSKISGKLKSVHNNNYVTNSLVFGYQDAAGGSTMMFGNRWGNSEYGHDIDIWFRIRLMNNSYSYDQTLYWDGSSLKLGSTSNTPRKWFFFEVEEVQ